MTSRASHTRPASWLARCVSCQARLSHPSLTAALLALTLALFMLFAPASLVALGLPAPSAAWADESEGALDNRVDPLAEPDGSFLYEVPIDTLLNAESYYSSQRVQITGEVVGDRIWGENEDGHCWITVSALPEDTPASVQVYTNYEDTDGIDAYGRYGVRGSTVTVRGVYYLVCPEHEGLSDIHATDITVTAPGYGETPPVDPSQFAFGGLLVAFGGLLFLYYRYVRERQR